eukprot:scaffold57211_cov47-Attheya_sp.AAC.1
MIKFLIPPLLLVCFINLAASDNSAGEPLFGNYGEYAKWPYYQTIGILIVLATILLSLGSVVFPDRYACLINDQNDAEAEHAGEDTEAKGQGEKYDEDEIEEVA